MVSVDSDSMLHDVETEPDIDLLSSSAAPCALVFFGLVSQHHSTHVRNFSPFLVDARPVATLDGVHGLVNEEG